MNSYGVALVSLQGKCDAILQVDGFVVNRPHRFCLSCKTASSVWDSIRIAKAWGVSIGLPPLDRKWSRFITYFIFNGESRNIFFLICYRYIIRL